MVADALVRCHFYTALVSPPKLLLLSLLLLLLLLLVISLVVAALAAAAVLSTVEGFWLRRQLPRNRPWFLSHIVS